MKAEIIVALDVPSAVAAEEGVNQLGSAIGWYKVGLELFTAEGPMVLDVLRRHNKRIFLDLKLHDIPNTVASAVRAAAGHQVDLLTVHAVGGRAMLTAATTAARDSGSAAPKLIAVTTLTSLSADDLAETGISRNIGDQAVALGHLALSCGIDGLVCSVHELESLRAALGADPILVTPGIRLAGDQVGDQKRVSTPAEAVQKGSSYLVVGRSLLHAKDPVAVVKAMQESMQSVSS